MIRVLDASGARALDNYMINELGQPGYMLMENAAAAVLDELFLIESAPVLILCGKGNNGGDGIALYRRLVMQGVEADIVFFSDPKALTGDAGLNFNIIRAVGLPFYVVDTVDEFTDVFCSKRFSVVVDALFGTGLSKDITGLYADVIEMVNKADVYRLAIDIPSGIHADSGCVMGIAFRADKTVTFQTVKRGHVLFPGREYTGELSVKPIGILDAGYGFTTDEFMLNDTDIKIRLPKRPLNTHKGDNGRALLIAGSKLMPGAAVMSALAAVRSGTGLLKVMCSENASAAINVRVPEAMTIPWNVSTLYTLKDAIKWATAIAIGPGLGNDIETADAIELVLEAHKPTIIDADGINTISLNRGLYDKLHESVILTPHPGEMQRLTEIPVSDITDNPYSTASTFAQKFNTNLLLKGATSIIAMPDGRICYNITGNPGLAKGGSGDVLTGIILALASQGLDIAEAAITGAYIMGKAADRAAECFGERSMTPVDVVNSIKL